MTVQQAVRRHTARWEVHVQGRQPGLATLRTYAHETRLRVGDRLAVPDPRTHAESGTLRSLLVADLHDDGRVHLVTRCAPPALLVRQDIVELLPAGGRSTADALLTDGDLLVMCSAATLDSSPAGIVCLLASGPRASRHRDPAQVVRGLLRGTMGGGAAVARFVAD
jgi:hypothetical protein